MDLFKYNGNNTYIYIYTTACTVYDHSNHEEENLHKKLIIQELREKRTTDTCTQAREHQNARVE